MCTVDSCAEAVFKALFALLSGLLHVLFTVVLPVSYMIIMIFAEVTKWVKGLYKIYKRMFAKSVIFYTLTSFVPIVVQAWRRSVSNITSITLNYKHI